MIYSCPTCLQKHSKYRHKLFTASHTLRGLYIGQDRYKRRFHILPNAGGVYVEGIESGELNENVLDGKDKIKDEKEKKRKRTSSGQSISDSNSTPTNEQKPKLSLVTQITENENDISGIKSPTQKNILQSPCLVSPIKNKANKVFDNEAQKAFCNEVDVLSPKQEILSPKTRIMSPSGGILSPTGSHHGNFLKSPNEVKETAMSWFHLFPKKACDETSLTRTSIIQPAINKGRMIVPPNVKLLSQDRSFCESTSDLHHMYMHGAQDPHGHHHHHHHGYHSSQGHHGNNGYHGAFTPNGTSHQIFHYPGMPPDAKLSDSVFQHDAMTKAGMLGLAPPGVDIQKLIKQDPQEAAVLLEIQSLEPAPVPEGKCIQSRLPSITSLLQPCLEIMKLLHHV